LVLIVDLNDAMQEKDFFRKALLATLGVNAIAGWLSELHSLPLIAELIVQSILLMSVGIAAVSARNPEQRSVHRLATGLLIVGGICLLVWGVAHLPADIDQDAGEVARGFALPLWL